MLGIAGVIIYRPRVLSVIKGTWDSGTWDAKVTCGIKGALPEYSSHSLHRQLANQLCSKPELPKIPRLPLILRSVSLKLHLNVKKEQDHAPGVESTRRHLSSLHRSRVLLSNVVR